MDVNPHDLDDDALKREMEQALDGISPDTLSGSTPHESGNPHTGERGRIRGRIVGVRDHDVFVDYGGKAEGFIALDEFEPENPPQVGQVFEFIPHGFDRDSGQMRLSLRETRTEADWDSIRVGDTIEAKVTGTNIGGLELSIHGVRAFMPKSQVDVERHEDFHGFVGRRLECEITEINRRGRNVLVSRRRVLERRLEEAREQIKGELAEGEQRHGVVKRIVDFGAFVDIGGIEGLLHVSDMSYARLSHPRDMVKVGDEVDVQILKLDLKRNRISLGLKQLAPDPWNLVEANYRAGATIEGRVTRLMEFGAFVELEPGIEGLIPISELSWTQRVKHPKDIVSPGDHVRVSVLAVDAERRRISLSLRAMSEDPWQGAEERYAVDSVVKGAVTRIAPFGAFIQLEEGIEGLAHISELSHQRVNQVGDVVKIGDVVECRVIDVKLDQRRISLSLKVAPDQHGPTDQLPEPMPQRKDRKRPLRGGLSW
ncbi:MAG: S1 RNA-binding domain-containing protein [Phycisphaerae bacterium]|nr:S1 RNA-binding domain-containing protein [Phycisphaerae bacterium]